MALDNMENVEEILTQIYHQIIIGPRNVPQAERTTDEVFVSFLSAFLAHMVTADGVVEWRTADAHYVRTISLGDPVASIDDVAALARPTLQHRLILNYRAEAEGVRPGDLIDRLLAVVAP